MFNVREKVEIIGELFGFNRRRPRQRQVLHGGLYDFLNPPKRQPGFSDAEIVKAIGHLPLSMGGKPAPDIHQDVRRRLLDRAFAEMDRLCVPLQRQYDWVLENCPDAVPPPIKGRSERQYICFNGAVPTTAAQVKMAVTNAVNTLQQVLSVTGTPITILEWGISFDASAAAVPVNCEFFSNDVAATAATAVTPTPFGVDTTASACVGGTGATMFNDGAITEGTVANARMYDCQLVPPTGSYWKQWPLGREPCMAAAKALRVRTTAPAAVNAVSYCVWAE